MPCSSSTSWRRPASSSRIGHTGGHGACIRDAVAAGARISTHLGNGSHAMLPRHENYIWEQLANDGLVGEHDRDGHHLPATVVRCILRVKTPARMMLTCDASPLGRAAAGEVSASGSRSLRLSHTHPTPHGVRLGSLAKSWLRGRHIWRARGRSPICAWATCWSWARPRWPPRSTWHRTIRAAVGIAAGEIAVGEPAELLMFHWAPDREFQILRTPGER